MKKNTLFRKLNKIQLANKPRVQSQTSRKQSQFKLNKQNQKGSSLHQIIINLQKNVKDLKKFQHQVSLGKTRSSHSCINIASFGQSRRKTLKKNKSQKKIDNQKQYTLQRQSVCKSGCQNGSTMISIHSGDIQQIRKAYFSVYGRYNSNIVELYNFYRKNIQKSTRIMGSMQISNFPQLQLSLVKQQSNKKCQTLLKNVVVEINDINNKQNTSQISIKNKNKKIIEQIFNQGSSDLINAGQVIKKRPLNGYFKRNSKCHNHLQKQNKDVYKTKQIVQQKAKEIVQIEQVNKKYQKEAKQQIKNTSFIKQIANKNILSSPKCKQTFLQQITQKKTKPFLQQKQFNKIKSSPFHNKEYKQSSQKQGYDKNIIELDEGQKKFGLIQRQQNNPFHENSFLNRRIEQLQIVQHSIRIKQKNQLKKYVNEFPLLINQQLNSLKKSKKLSDQSQLSNSSKKSKYYISPDRIQKKGVINELQDCSISFKESPRIIDLDFIPLDL